MIKEFSVEFKIKECCEALRVSRSGFYQWKKAELSQRAKQEAQLVKQIAEIFEANKGRYGSPRRSPKNCVTRAYGVGRIEWRV
jgi:hypothetical protein